MNGGSEITHFFRALAKHWLALMSGGLVIVGLSIVERATGRNVQPWLYAFLVAGLIVIASYLAWRDERRKQKQWSMPVLEGEFHEAIIEPVLHNAMRCFTRLTMRNQNEDTPCTIDRCVLSVRIGEQWYETTTSVDVRTAELVTKDQLDHPRLVPMHTPYSIDDGGLPIIEVGRENIPSLLEAVDEEHPLKRGFPKSGWLGFYLEGLPSWRVREKGAGRYESEIDRETGEEFFVEEKSVVRSTGTVDELKLKIIDGHGAHHVLSRTRPFGIWSRSIESRRPREWKLL